MKISRDLLRSYYNPQRYAELGEFLNSKEEGLTYDEKMKVRAEHLEKWHQTCTHPLCDHKTGWIYLGRDWSRQTSNSEGWILCPSCHPWPSVAPCGMPHRNGKDVMEILRTKLEIDKANDPFNYPLLECPICTTTSRHQECFHYLTIIKNHLGISGEEQFSINRPFSWNFLNKDYRLLWRNLSVASLLYAAYREGIGIGWAQSPEIMHEFGYLKPEYRDPLILIIDLNPGAQASGKLPEWLLDIANMRRADGKCTWWVGADWAQIYRRYVGQTEEGRFLQFVDYLKKLDEMR